MTEASTGLALQDVAGRPGASIAEAIEAAVDDGRLGTLERLAVLGLLAARAAREPGGAAAGRSVLREQPK